MSIGTSRKRKGNRKWSREGILSSQTLLPAIWGIAYCVLDDHTSCSQPFQQKKDRKKMHQKNSTCSTLTLCRVTVCCSHITVSSIVVVCKRERQRELGQTRGKDNEFVSAGFLLFICATDSKRRFYSDLYEQARPENIYQINSVCLKQICVCTCTCIFVTEFYTSGLRILASLDFLKPT